MAALVPLTIRLNPNDAMLLKTAADVEGLPTSRAGALLLSACLKYIRTGNSYWELCIALEGLAEK